MLRYVFSNAFPGVLLKVENQVLEGFNWNALEVSCSHSIRYAAMEIGWYTIKYYQFIFIFGSFVSAHLEILASSTMKYDTGLPSVSLLRIMLQLHGTGHMSHVHLHLAFCIELRATCLSSRHRGDYMDIDRLTNPSISRDRSEYGRPRARDRDRYRNRSRSRSPDYRRERQRSRYDDDDDEKVRSRSLVRKFTLKHPNFKNIIKLALKPPDFLICSSGTFLAGVDSVA
ncbi:hypothetical protein Tco_0058219 [Tanacetum coccineum]